MFNFLYEKIFRNITIDNVIKNWKLVLLFCIINTLLSFILTDILGINELFIEYIISSFFFIFFTFLLNQQIERNKDK